MDSGLPFNLDDLLHRRTIENNRVELKAAWNSATKAAVVRTVCAFANDVLNLNGGYLVLGVEEQDGRAVLPARGLEGTDLEKLQREIRGACNRIDPGYQPYLFPAEHLGRSILVVWAPGGDNRPYQAPETLIEKGARRHYYLRRGPETIRARGESLRQLMELAAKIPFDDRRSLAARVESLSATLIRSFLHDVGSRLVEVEPDIADREIYRRLRLVVPVNDHEVPRNVALMFFTDEPDRFFPGSRIEVVIFADGAGGDLIEEHVFRGPLPSQIRSALGFLESRGGTLIRKVPGRAEAEHEAAYPQEAVEEAIANGVYHRGYDGPPEPLKVYLYPDRMEVTTYPGPVLGIEAEHFEPGASIPPLPARNRRIGELLKELRLAEGRGTGVPKIQRAMQANGSLAARFDFDAARTYFRVTLPIHPSHLQPTSETQSDAGREELAAALRKLQARLAAGEISLEEYRQIKAEILADSGRLQQ